MKRALLLLLPLLLASQTFASPGFGLHSMGFAKGDTFTPPPAMAMDHTNQESVEPGPSLDVEFEDYAPGLRFGWEGDDLAAMVIGDDIIWLMDVSPFQQCIDQALAVCGGSGTICRITFRGDIGLCDQCCKDGDGRCSHCRDNPAGDEDDPPDTE